MIWELLENGMLPAPSMAWTSAGIMLIIVSSFFLSRMKMVVPMIRFIMLVLLVTVLCVFIPAGLWLYLTLVITGWFLFSGLAVGWLLHRYRMLDLKAGWHQNTALRFAGSTGNISLTPESLNASVIFRKLIHWLKLRGELFLEGTDSNYYEISNTVEESTFPFEYTDDSELNHICRVDFILRGHDSGSSLYAAYQLAKPWRYIIPWQRRIKLAIPEITILSSGFASFAGVSIPQKNEHEKKHPIRRESRFQSEAFLHIGGYSTGEPLSRIDFKTGLRLNQLVSRKYAETIDLRCLVAIGLGRRAQVTRSTELILSRLGRILAENASSQVSSDLVIFDLGRRYEKSLEYNPHKILSAGKELSFINASFLEEDEFVLVDNLGRRIRDYTYLRLVVAWGGRIDLSRTFEAVSMFRKNGVRVEITVVAAELLEVLEKNSDSDASGFFREMMLQNRHRAEKAGIKLNWVAE